MRTALEEEFLRLTLINPSDPDDHWLWAGSHYSNGYARWHRGAVDRGAHVLWYERIYGPVDNKRKPEPGAVRLVLDHLCRWHPCVNPSHLELVPQQVNVRRGKARFNGAENRSKRSCPQGHPYDEVNTGWRTDPDGSRFRACRTCARERWRESSGYYERVALRAK